jgi:hypothetical protein
MILLLEKQVCSLELAKRLKELDVKQESLFYWNTDKAFIGDEHMYVVCFGKTKNIHAVDMYSAFTSAELGEMLPAIYPTNEDDLTCVKDIDGEWSCGYQSYSEGSEDIWITKVFFADTESNARAKMLIYLLENNLVNLKDINKGE